MKNSISDFRYKLWEKIHNRLEKQMYSLLKDLDKSQTLYEHADTLIWEQVGDKIRIHTLWHRENEK